MSAQSTSTMDPVCPPRLIQRQLEAVDVRLDGSRPWDMQVHDQRTMQRIMLAGSSGLRDSYVDGWWDCPHLDVLFTHLLRGRIGEHHWPLVDWLLELQAALVNRRRPPHARAADHQSQHLHPELHREMLGEELIHTCGYWRAATTLEAAQTAKIDLVCRKLGLAPGMRVLDLGCGWGAAARHAAQRHGVEVVGITTCHEQAVVARSRCVGLPVTFLEQDYRQLQGSFDRIFSITMFEHIGPWNHHACLDMVRRCLAEDGLFLVHTIGADRALTMDGKPGRSIFPNAVMPSARWLLAAAEDRFVIQDWHNFAPDYDRTLMAWHTRSEETWDARHGQDDACLRRRWRYCLLSYAALFRARMNQVWQMVLSPRDGVGGQAAAG